MTHTSQHMKKDVSLRNATLGDATKLAEYLTLLGYDTTASQMEERMKKILPNPDYKTLVAEHMGQVIGMVGLLSSYLYERDEQCGRILEIFVEDEFRGQGIGELFISEAEDWFKSKNVSEVVINSSKKRKKAHAFYKKVGFKDTGLRFIKELSRRPD